MGKVIKFAKTQEPLLVFSDVEKLLADLKTAEIKVDKDQKDQIDLFGRIDALIGEFQAAHSRMKKRLTMKPGAYEGHLFRLTISEYDHTSLDMEAVRAKLSPQFIAAHTRKTPVRKYQAKARTGKMLAVPPKAKLKA